MLPLLVRRRHHIRMIMHVPVNHHHHHTIISIPIIINIIIHPVTITNHRQRWNMNLAMNRRVDRHRPIIAVITIIINIISSIAAAAAETVQSHIRPAAVVRIRFRVSEQILEIDCE